MARRSRRSVLATETQGRVNGVPNVQYSRHELRKKLSIYDKIRDCLEGSEAIKDKGDKYLPRPNADDKSEENLERYNAYLTRAVFYNVVRRTVYALVGQIFMRAPQVDIPPALDVLKLDATGTNITLEQVASTTGLYTLAYGRAGLHVDYPSVGVALTRAQLDTGDIRPIITVYPGREIINWRKALRGSRSVYTLIVVREDFTSEDDGFEAKTEKQYKVMRLVTADEAGSVLIKAAKDMEPNDWNDMFGNALAIAVSAKTDVYRLEVWRNTGDRYGFNLAELYFPKDSKGNFLNEIPWMFVGSENNDDSVDHPPMADMSELNIAHYRNSADYEEASFLVGQPTPVVSGVTQEWAKDVLKGSIQLGSRGVIALPVGGMAQLLQAAENTMPHEAMQLKERQMVALGAKLVEQRQVQRTATEAQMEGTADTSILANIAKNVSTAVEWAIKKACVFTGDDPNAVSFILNTEFDLTRMDPAERQQLLLEYQGGSISFGEMRANLRRGGVATMDDAEARTAIEADQKLRLATDVARTKAIGDATPKTPTVGSNNQPKPKG